MTKQVQLRRGTNAEHQVFTGAVGEVTVDTTFNTAVVHDGATAGGFPLVNTGVGATVNQGIVNKAFLGINTATTGEYSLLVVGDSVFEGDVSPRSLNVFYDPNVERTGTLDDFNPNFITGVATDNIRIGYLVSDSSASFDADTIVSSIGINSIGISPGHLFVGVAATTIVFTDQDAGATITRTLTVTESANIPQIGVGTVNVTEGFFETIGVGTLTSTELIYTSGFGSDLTVGTIQVDTELYSPGFTNLGTSYIAVGVVTDLVAAYAGIATADIVTGIVTNLNSDTIDVVNLYAGSGIITDLQSANSFISVGVITNTYAENLQSNVGFITNLTNTEFVSDNVFIASGIVTASLVQAENLLSTNTYINAGVITDLYSTTSTLLTANITTGIITDIASTNATSTNLYARVGVVTDLQSSTAYINAGIITEVSSQEIYSDVGIVTTLHTNAGFANTLRINSGLATDLVVTGFATFTQSINDVLSNSNRVDIGIGRPYNQYNIEQTVGINTNVFTGVGTSKILSSVEITGTSTDLNNGTFTSVASTTTSIGQNATFAVVISGGNIESITIEKGGNNYDIDDIIYLDTGVIGVTTGTTQVNVAGVSTITPGQLVFGVGFQKGTVVTGVGTELFEVNAITTNTGVLTDSNIEFASPTTESLVVAGDARITGILSANSVSLFGTDSSITGVDLIDSNSITATRLAIDAPTTIIYQGTLAVGNTNFITGVATEGLSVGYGITNNYLPAGTEVVSVATSAIELNNLALNNIPSQTTQGYARIGGGLEIAGINTSNIFVGSDVTGTYVGGGTTVVSIGVGIVTVTTALLELNGEQTYSGIVTETNSPIITGIATANIVTGQTVFADSYVLSDTKVVSVGSSSITIDKPTTQPGPITLDFTFRLLDQYSFAYPTGAIVTDNFTFLDKITGLSTIPFLEGKDAIFSGIGSFDSLFARQLNLNVAAGFDEITVAGVVTASQIVANTGIITDLAGTSLTYTGISSIGDVAIGSGNTSLIVHGDARILGVLSIGQGTVTIDGNESGLLGASQLQSVTGIITNISGTNQNYTGITTLNQVGLTTLTLNATNDDLSQDSSVTLKTAVGGASSTYTLTLPAEIGGAGQVLAITNNGGGELGFTTAGLYEARYYVSARNGDDAYDGKALPVRTIRKAAQLASFNSFVIPGQRFLDAGNLLEENRTFLVTEAISALNFNYENLATDFPDYDEAVWRTKLGTYVDNLIYDIRFGGNSKAIETGNDIWDGGTNVYAGEEEQAIYAYNYIKFIGQYILNNQSPPTLYATGISTVSQYFDFTITDDPNNTNANYFHTSKDARNLILANKLEIVDKSLAAIAVGVTNGNDFFFPGDTESNERSRFYSAYRLIQKNKQEIIDYAWADTVVTYPGISTTEVKCKRDLGYFVDAVSTDVFTGGNNYTRSFLGFYFQGGAPLGNGLVGEEIESNHAFTEAAVGMSSALTNTLSVIDTTIPADPATGSNTNGSSCANVRSTVSTLTGIVTTSVSAGSTAGIGTTTNYGYFNIQPDLNVSDSVGIGSTNIFGGRKCARDLNYIVDAIAQDVAFDTNQNIIYNTKFYFDGAGVLKSNGVAGEAYESILAFHATRDLAKKAITNQLNNRDLTVIADPATGFNTDPTSCNSTQSQIGTLVGILTSALDSASLVGIASTSIGITDCADVRTAFVNYAGIVTSVIGFGTAIAPAISLPETQSKPIAIFVEAGEYVEQNPIILFDDVAIIGDNLRNTIIRPANAGKDLFRVRNGCYVTGFAMKDSIDVAGIPQFTFDNAVAYDDPSDTFTSRSGYATQQNKPIIFRSPYIQNCSILSFLGANGILVDGSKVQSPNVPVIPGEAENPVEGDQPEQGKSMVAAAFTMVSFGGIGWRVINDGYSQVVSCFQIFCRYGSLTQSGGYLSITNSATNFGLFALRSTGFSQNSFRFDRGRIATTGTSGGLTTLKTVGLGRSEQDLYVARFINDDGTDLTANFKAAPVTEEFTGTAVPGGSVDIVNNQFTLNSHPFSNGDSVIYLGDEDAFPQRIIGGLISQNQYFVTYIDANTFKLSEDDSGTRIVNLSSVSTGIHTFTKNTQEFFASSIIDRHRNYQRISIPGTQALQFVPGREVQQSVAGGNIAVGIAFTYNNTDRDLIVSVELSNDVRRNFQVTDGVNNLNISDHSGSPISTTITAIAGVSTYWTVEAKMDSTLAGGQILNPSNLPESFKLHYHRPSIINSSSHTWEYSGSGTDYNALPQNGGTTDPNSEQLAETGGRVFTSGTNELGDFKIGDFITAFNRTGNIIFNNTVTIGTLDSIRLSLSGGVAVEEFSIDGGMGDNESGGPLNSRVSTQLAVRTFLANRLGSFIDKLVSTNAVPNAVVQLNNIGQINSDLIPPKTVNYFKSTVDGGRTQLVNQIPAVNLNTGDTVVEPTDSFVLITDLISQYIILDNSSVYNFNNQDIIVSVNSAGAATGIVTAPTTSGIGTAPVTLSFPNVGYGTTGLVRGVPLTLKDLNGGSGYSTPGTYAGVRLDTASGIGTGITGTIIVGASGTVSNVAIATGGFKFDPDDVLTLNDPSVIGGRSGGSNFTVKVNAVETRLYVALSGSQKFQGSTTLPDYFADGNAVGYSTNIGIGLTVSFTATDIGVGGDVDFTNNRIVLGSGHGFADGDHVKYKVTGGTVMENLVDDTTFYVKKVGISSIQLYTTYALSTPVTFVSSGTGTQELTRSGINAVTDQITFVNHPFTQGDPVRITGNTPTGITTGNFFFVGSVTENTFTVHETRAQALTSINGLLLNTIDLADASDPVGTMTLTEQNIEYTSHVNTSSNDSTNFSLLSSSSLDASNIITGTFVPTRLGGGVATEETFLAGDSNYRKVVTSVGVGTTSRFDVKGYSSVIFAPGGVGVTTYFGNVILDLERVSASLDDYSTLGIAQYKMSTFNIGEDGRVTIKNSTQGGDIDAATLQGNSGSYYLNTANHQGAIPISRGGTGLTGLPSNGSILQGNGSAYNLTTSPTFIGDVTFSGGAGAVSISAGSDIRFTTTSTWTGESAAKIQYYSNNLYLQYTTNTVFRNSSGANRMILNSSGALDVVSTVTASRFISDVANGTAPLTVTSSTKVSNLNVDLLDGISSGSFLRSDATDSASGVLTFTAGNNTTSHALQLSNGYLNIPHDELCIRFDEGQKMITSNDGGGNFNFRSGHNYNLQHVNSSSGNSGLAGIVLNTDGTAGQIGLGLGPQRASGSSSTFDYALILDRGTSGLKWKVGSNVSPFSLATSYTIWHSGNDGSGSGLDADTVDGIQASSFLRGDTSDTFTTLSGTVLNIGNKVELRESTDRADLLQITGTTSGWAGLQIRNSSNEGRWSFMINGANAGIYDDENNKWHIYMQENNYTVLYYNGSSRLLTSNSGISVTGTMTASSNVTANSDIRLKTNIVTIEDALAKTLSLRGVTFDRTDIESNDQIGVIAQEVEEVLPSLVHIDEDTGIKSVAYQNIVAVLIEAIKEQQVQIDELREEVKKLKG